MSSRFILFTLGSFRVDLEDRPLTGLSGGKTSALLAYLAMQAGKRLARDTLAELLWPNLSIKAARSNLRHTFFHLSKMLQADAQTQPLQGQPLLLSDREWLSFNSDGHFWLDAAEFTTLSPATPASQEIAQLEHLAGLYRGEFMAGFYLPNCPEFEAWLQAQREALHRHALTLLEQLSHHHEQLGDFGRALKFALRYTALEPWDERGHRKVMHLYAQNGQNGAALAQFEACCQVLKKELRALPSEETRQLAERIRMGGRHAPISPPAQSRRVSVSEVSEARQPFPMDRRQVTVLYCELSFTPVDDLDEAMERLRGPQARCAEIIRQFSGHIVQAYGGGLLAYFGYPQAHEDAARHAVQAAMALTQRVAGEIEIRAGVHTGTIITSGDAAMPDTVGKASQLAIQVCRHAAPNEVAISRETHHLVNGYFACSSLGMQRIPGFVQPREIFRAVAASGARSRLEAAARLSPLIGRTAEIAHLKGLWGKTGQGHGHVVLIQGEPGMGKSRLLHTLKGWLTGQPHAICELRCFPEFSQSPFYPLIAALEAACGFANDDTHEIKSGKLLVYLETHYPASAPEAIALLSLLLSLPPTENYPAPHLSPQQQKERTIAILLDILQVLAARQPVLFIVEDLHWIDPSTRELLTRFVEQKSSGAVLALFTARPEFDPPWDNSLESTLTLAPLAESEVAQLVASIGQNIPAGTLHRIVQRADGVPLFAEEMAKMASTNHLAGIPATLHDLLAARMDHLGEAKTTAQLAATIGREFALDLLHRVSPHDAKALARNLSALQEAGLILPVSETVRQFKHALIQEAAYQSQTKAGRQAAHIGIAQALQHDFPEVAATQPEVIAQHFNAGSDARQAIDYWLLAAERVMLHSASVEATEYLKAALAALDGLPADLERDRREFALQVRLGHALQTTLGFGANAALQAFHKAVALSGNIGHAPGLFQALNGLCFGVSSYPDAGNTEGLAIAHRMMDIAQESGDPHLLQQAHFVLGYTLFWIGDFAASRRHHAQSVALDAAIPWDERLDNTGRIAGLSSQVFLSWLLWLEGFPAEAQAMSRLSIEQARRHAHPNTLAFTLYFAAGLQRWLENPEAALAFIEESLLLAQENELILWLVFNTMLQGWVFARQGKSEGVTQIKMCIEQLRMVMGGVLINFTLALAEVLLQHGQAEEALDVLNESLADGEKKNDHHAEAELHRLKGEALMQLSRHDEAEACLKQALEVSRKQGAKSLELRTTISMARLNVSIS